MININATLLVQALHFFIVWFLLDRFLIRFLVQQVIQDETHEQDQKKELLKKQELIEAQVLLQKEHLHTTKERFKLLYPEKHSFVPFALCVTSDPHSLEPDENKKNILKTSLEAVIIKRVIHE